MNQAFENFDFGFREIFRGERSSESVLAIVKQIHEKDRIIHVNGNLKLTKSGLYPTRAFLLRDFELERSVYEVIQEMGVNNWSWVGILSGRTEDVKSAIRNIEICNNGKWQTPCY